MKTSTNSKTLTSNNRHYIIRSRYIEQIEHILSVFSRKQLYIGISEQIKTNKTNEYQKIADFITNFDTKTNLIPICINANTNKSFSLVTKVKDTNIGNYKDSIKPDIEKQLYEYFNRYNERLYQFLGYRITEWEKYYKSKNLM